MGTQVAAMGRAACLPFVTVFALSMGGSLLCACFAQAPAGIRPPGPPSSTPRTGEISVVCTVSDRSGRFLTGLTQRDFEIPDNKRPQKIERVAFADEIPLSIVVFVDASASSLPYLSAVQDEVIGFVKDTLLPRGYRFKIIGFSTAGAPVAHAGRDLQQLARVIRAFKPAGRTPLLDIVVLVCRQLVEERGQPGSRQVVLILSDGDDNLSKTAVKQGIEFAQRAGIVISTISTGLFARYRLQRGLDELDRGALTLRSLSSDTGGTALAAGDLKSLKECFRSVAGELENQYVLSYKPEPPAMDARFRSITVSVTGRNKVSVRAAKGYYASP